MVGRVQPQKNAVTSAPWKLRYIDSKENTHGLWNESSLKIVADLSPYWHSRRCPHWTQANLAVILLSSEDQTLIR